MKYFNSLVLLFLFSVNITKGETDKSLNTLAIIIESESINDQEIVLIENRLTSYILNTEEVRVLARRELDVLLKEQKLQLTGLFDERNIINPGELFGASDILYGVITDVGNAWNFDFKVINVSSGIIESSTNEIVLKDLISMLNAIDDIGSILFNHKSEALFSTKSILPDIPVRDFRLSNKKLTINQQIEQTITDSKIIGIDNISDHLIICSYKGSIDRIEFNPDFSRYNLFNYPKWSFSCSKLEGNSQHYSVASPEGIVYLWDTEHWGSPYQLLGHSSTVNSIAFSVDGQFIYSGDEDGRLIIWDNYTYDVYMETTISYHGIETITNTGDGKGLFILLEDGSVNLYSLDEHKIVITEHGRRRVSSDIVINNSNNLMVTGNDDGSIQIWEISYYSETQYIGETWFQPFIKLQETIALNDVPVSALSFSPSDDLVAVGYLNGELIFLDMISRENYTIDDFSLNDNITTLKFLNNKKTLIGTQKGKLLVMNI